VNIWLVGGSWFVVGGGCWVTELLGGCGIGSVSLVVNVAHPYAVPSNSATGLHLTPFHACPFSAVIDHAAV
jgi:hypothetical protein